MNKDPAAEIKLDLRGVLQDCNGTSRMKADARRSVIATA